jgi:hypothetical protein
MTSWRQFEANRRNAVRSTGPKSLEGKRVSRAVSKSAIVHGGPEVPLTRQLCRHGRIGDGGVSIYYNGAIDGDSDQRADGLREM